GTIMFMATERRDWRQTGRILVGIGLLILSLEMIGQASEPLRDSQLMPVIIDYFSGDAISSYLLAALITWLFQSSIAAVLLMATLAGRGLITPELGVVLILGVNLGSSIIAPMLTRSAAAEVRIVPIGNLLMRGLGSLVMLILFMIFRPHFSFLGTTASGQIVNAHILF
ncbi:MAG: Na/Pi cotransporter family protein, partial [Mesorhizobium sp.]